VAFSQNHDQLGNRAQGDRMCHLTSAARERIGAALVLTSPFIPLLFMGEEWSASSPFQFFVSFEEPGLCALVKQGRLREFAAFIAADQDLPDPADPATYARSKLRWEEVETPAGQKMVDWYRQLIALRRRTAVLTNGRLDLVDVRFSEPRQWLVMERGPVTVACNFALEAQPIPLTAGQPAGILLASHPAAAMREDSLSAPPESVTILGVAPIDSYTWSAGA
jgi:maltooligosyltrehalose trehalohydrolase